MIRYTQDFLCRCQQEVEPLAALEWQESGRPTEALEIDWDRYADLEDHGIVRFYVARDGDDLIGYAVVLLFSPLTMRERRFAIVDAVYVAKTHRGIGKALFAFVEDCLREDGIERLVASSSATNPIGAFLTRMGYEEAETKYEKAL